MCLARLACQVGAAACQVGAAACQVGAAACQVAFMFHVEHP